MTTPPATSTAASAGASSVVTTSTAAISGQVSTTLTSAVASVAMATSGVVTSTVTIWMGGFTFTNGTNSGIPASITSSVVPSVMATQPTLVGFNATVPFGSASGYGVTPAGVPNVAYGHRFGYPAAVSSA
ncbi:hypothetical protein PF008_g10211 [Phytophthora fragariae]|uniref:Uncharacterized protein n=1 Tax=Phytophthora fragariae TaxID=53985 RepID=A0A6G0RUD9_9STRA|nr:hypothetical protein PF008_g10211 [Phytophthora fragariae]